ncbi:aspartate carbamoyltransferase catalytic subunit [Staphylospora marina]|uniref:aspartate carbamoyltransferase catalytic subunit n=1 Tax=Staphylospora marina TaxID=2490858 RepID=UPI000F5BCD68|nr:aspartate carbamoyltransferase catalytic subunit [Staphylospora marina]
MSALHLGNHVHLLDTSGLDRSEMTEILDRAAWWERSWTPGTAPLAGRFAANLFFEPSTRTRFSFEVAETKLGLHAMNFTPEISSTAKGESLYDTVRTLASIGVEVAVIRHSDPDAIRALVHRDPGLAVINAGAGSWAHPTQALLDLYTMRKRFKELSGLTVAIIGDLAHSRVLRSNIHALKTFGARVILSGPPEMRAPELEAEAAYVPFESALAEADVVMLLRVQLERHDRRLFSSAEEYHAAYGLNHSRLERMKPHAVIMHPAPVNRGVEIDGDLVEHPRSLIFEQMSNGVWIRMAVLERALEGGRK